MQLEDMKQESDKEPNDKRALAEQKAVADDALKQFSEASEKQQAFVEKHSLGKWGFLISFLAAAGFVLGCVFSDLMESGLIILICIVGFIVVFLVVEFLLCLIVDSAMRAAHKQERDKLRQELTDTKDKFYEEEKKYLEMWCDKYQSEIYTVVIDEEVKTPNTSQRHVLTRYTGCSSTSADLILRKREKSNRMNLTREWAIPLLIGLLENRVQASLEIYDRY